jgi:hypothetical protein
MRARRRRSFAAVVGRLRISSPEQEAALLAPSAASRILELLLGLSSEGEREALLPDCFTPPPEGGSAAAEDAETDELWCTPLQLLNEIDARVRDVVEARGGGGFIRLRQGEQAALGGGSHGLSGGAYEAALRHLRAAVAERWLDTLPAGATGSSSEEFGPV